MNPNVNCGLRMIKIDQCRFISYNKYTTLVGDVDNGGVYACMVAGGIWELCTLH